jgi:bisanhydrobacterioruberin hydratase
LSVEPECPLTLSVSSATDAVVWRKAGHAALALLTAATALLCLPFLARTEIAWSEMNPWLLAITATSTLAITLHACMVMSPQRGLAFLALALFMSLVAEFNGTRWHLPFGYRYVYDPAVQPRLWSELPLCVPPLWVVLAYTALVFLRRMRVRAGGRIVPARLLLKVGLCSLYLMATDLFLDPLGVSVGTWTWPEGGAYFGIPILNYAGWLVVGVLIFLPWFALAKDEPAGGGPAGLDIAFAIVSIGLTILCLAACVWRLGIWLPTVLSAPVLAPVWIYWLAGLRAGKPCPDAAPGIALPGKRTTPE